MTLREDLAVLPRRVHDLTNNLALALTNIRDGMDECDGYPATSVGASAPEARTPAIMHGNCLEYIHTGDTTVQCGRARPCGEHDVNDTRLDPVERAAARSAVLERGRQEILNAVGVILRATDNAERSVRRWMPASVVDTKKLLCQGTPQLPGYMDWYDPLCRQVADQTTGGLCLDCYRKETVWRASQQLPPRDRSHVAAVRDIPMCTRGDGRTATPGRSDGLCGACRMSDSRARGKAS